MPRGHHKKKLDHDEVKHLSLNMALVALVYSVDYHTGLEVGWQGEVGLAATRRGITQEKANEIALKLLPLYQDTFNNPKLGQLIH